MGHNSVGRCRREDWSDVDLSGYLCYGRWVGGVVIGCVSLALQVRVWWGGVGVVDAVNSVWDMAESPELVRDPINLSDGYFNDQYASSTESKSIFEDIRALSHQSE